MEHMVRKLVCLATVAGLGFGAFGEMIDEAIFRCKMPITVTAGKVSSTLANFPVLVRLSAERQPGFVPADCGEGGVNLRFALDDGTLLAHEIDTWNPDGESCVWVNIPSLTAETEFYAYWKTGADVILPEIEHGDVWPNFIAVWHLSEESGEVLDSSKNGYDVTNGSTVASSDLAIVGRSRNVQGGAFKTGVLTLSDTDEAHPIRPLSHVAKFTISGWMRDASTVEAGYRTLMSKGAYQADGWCANTQNNRTSLTAVGYNAKTKQWNFPSGKTLNGQWHYLTLSYNDGTAQCWLDGAALATSWSTLQAPNESKTHELTFSGGMTGYVDEMRMMDGAISDAWAKADYATQNTGDFLSFGEIGGTLFAIEPIPDQPLTGAAIEPAPVVTVRGRGAALVRDQDYEVAYSNNTAAGTGYVFVTGKGDYDGYWQLAKFLIVRRVFVKPDALDGGTGVSWEDAMTLTNAIQLAATSGIPVEVYMAAGTYSQTGHTLATTVIVRGATGDPSDVIINDNTAGKRAFTISHAGAVVRDLTIKGSGIHTYGKSYYGGHINMSAGTVENCIIRDGFSNAGAGGGHSYGRGGNVYMTGGRLVRCQILNGNLSASGGSDGEYGGGVFASGAAVIDSCLVKGNNPNNVSKGWGGGIYAEGAVTVANCTIVGNKVNGNSSGGGIYVNSASVKVVNCILCDNGGTAVGEFGDKNLGRFFHCASSVTNESCATWMMMSKGDFTGFEADDFHLSLASPLLDGGSLDAAWYPPGATTLDIDGNPRVSGLAIDLGCYEADQSRVIASGAVSSYCGYEGTNMTLTASAKGGTGGPYLYRWDCGNGVTNVTADAVSSYAWPDSGLYVIKVQASDNGGATWGAWSTLPVKLVIAPKTVYVDGASANPTYPYKTPATAAKKISDVLVSFTNNVSSGLCAVDGLTVRVLPGTVADTGMQLAAAVEIVGDTGDPRDVIINDNTAGKRAFTISHAGAVIRDLTIKGAGIHTYNAGGGGHINMTAGTVENCIIRDGYSNAGASGGHSRGSGGTVYLTGGRIVRCQILNGQTSNSGSGFEDELGGGVYAGGTAVVDSCFVKDCNASAGGRVYGGGICVDGSATVANCTIVGCKVNANASGGGIYVRSSTAKVVNTILFNNGGTAVSEFGTANLGRFFHCASSVTNASCATWTLMTKDDFAGFEANDFHLSLSSPLVDGGSMEAEWYPPDATTLDMDGLPRVSGSAIDLGCLEADQSKVNASGAVSSYSGLEGTNLTLTATAKGGTGGPYLYRWDLGNGVTNETDEAVSAYAWPDSGLYVIKVSASDDDGVTWGAWATLPVKVVIAPETVYVDAASANPAYPYKTRETAATKISTVLTAFTNNVSAGLCAVDGLTVRVLSGTVADTGMNLAAAVEIVGDTGDPKDVVINDSTAGKRAFTISHAGAAVRGLTISGTGFKTTYSGGTASSGGHITMTAGTVENCIITGGNAATGHAGGWGRGQGGNVYMTGGRLVRSQILNGVTVGFKQSKDEDSRRSYGAGVYAAGTAVVNSCLIKGNGSDTLTYGMGVYVAGNATVANCTVVNSYPSSGYPGAGVYVGGDAAKVVNCILYNNGGTDVAEFGNVRGTNYFHCASTVTNESCETWMMMSANDFMDVAISDYRLKFDSNLLDVGSRDPAWYPEAGTAKDLGGLARVSGAEIDVGCHEVDQSHISCNGVLDVYGSAEGRPVGFQAYAIGTKARVKFRWDFGNGVIVETYDGRGSYAYPASGLFAVRVSASADDGVTWCDWFDLETKIAVVPETMWVDPNSENPTPPYKTRETASRTIAAALQLTTNNVSGGYSCIDDVTIRLVEGAYVESGTVLKSGIAIVGDTGDPNDVVINDNTPGKRAFNLQHAGAVVRDLTIKGSGTHTYGSGYYGGHVNMTAGTVENCIIRDGYSNAGASGGWSYGAGGNVYMTGGRLVRCQILNGQTSNSGSGFVDELGGGVYAGGTAVVDSCLVKDCNANAVGRGYGGGICVDGSAIVANCVIVGCKVNANAAGAGIYVKSATAKVVNTILFDNGGTDVTEFGTANLGRFFHCASTVTNASCATWMSVSAGDFVSVPTANFRLQPTSALVDAGSTDSEWYPDVAAERDLDGNPRVSISVIDLGCYEIDQSKISVGGVLSSYGGLEGRPIRFTASAKGGTGGAYTYRWDFGNGHEETTTDAEIEYAYPESGLYTVRVSAMDDGGEWTDWVALAQNVAVMPAVTYVDANSANPTYPYKTRETAATKVSTVLLAMTNNVSADATIVSGATVRVCAGTVGDTGLKIASAVTICGDTGDPNDVVINDNTAGKRGFTLTHAGAVIRDLTIKGQGVHTYQGGSGGHVNMTAGTVENCIIKDGRSNAGQGGGHSYGHGGNVYMTGGRLVRCQILNGQTSNNGAGFEDELGGGVYAGGTGVVESCIVRDCNLNAGGRVYGGGICVDGSASVVNCTVIGCKVNANASGGGVYLRSAKAKVVNTVMFDNGGTPTSEFGNANLDCYAHCASSTNNASCATWQVIDETAFRDWASRETNLRALVPAVGKPLCGTGTDADGYRDAGGTSTVDLRGRPRRIGKRLDIGCLEANSAGGALIVK